MKNRLLLLLSAFAVALNAQTSFTLQRTLNWADAPYRYITPGGQAVEVWNFDKCLHGDAAPTLPIFSERFDLPGAAEVAVDVVSVQWEPFAKKTSADDAVLRAELNVQTDVSQERRQFYGWVKFYPIRKTGNGFERATAFVLNVRILPKPVTETAADRGGPYTYTSVLSNGTAYKFGVSQTAVYKLDFNFLKNELGISNLESIDPRSIRIYGNGGGMLPEKTNDTRPDDLVENAIFVSGEADGKFDAGDFILFYATGPEPWVYRASQSDPEISIRKHLYDRKAWYFVKTGDGQGLRIQEQASVAATAVTEQFDDVRRIEDERVNLLDFFSSAQGSGKRWFGDYFYQTRKRDYSFEFPNLAPGATARLRMEFAGRSAVSSVVRAIADGTTFSRNVPAVSVANNDADYAANAIVTGTFSPKSEKFTVQVDYPEVGQQSEGWVDYIEINARRRLTLQGQMMEFRDLQSLLNDATTFRLSGVTGNLTVWDVTNRQIPFKQAVSANGGVVEFGAATKNILRNFIAFNDNAAFPKPEEAVGKLETQNVHATDNVHMVIVYHPDFETSVQKLAEHRRNFGKLDVATIRIDQLFNEFSSGAKDPTAIRDFARMVYERNPDKFEYLLLFGDGSFDPKNNTASEDNKDFIPVFETYESYSPIYAYPSDDYFCLLSDGEGSALKGSLDIALGRIPAETAEDAANVVDKIIAYDNTSKTLGDWHLRLIYMADDEDSNAHVRQADELATASAKTEDWFNLEKIYFDAYQQVATSTEKRIPDAKASINANMFRGALIAQYIGHGGPRGWAQERVIDNNDISGWENADRCPLIITATCSFGGYDDYTTLTGGEQVLLKAKSGAVGLFTTTRAVFISGNDRLTDGVQSFIFERPNGWYLSIGDILKRGKNSLTLSADEENARRFTLLGDPAMYLAMPEYRVRTTKINGKTVDIAQPDTLSALMPVEIEGEVTDTLGNYLPDFNGKAYVTLFDKKQTLNTLGQDDGSFVQPFSVQRNTLFKGSATVKDGRFKINFIVPKDINYAFGAGKISYYAENGTPLDAAGADERIVIGGTANNVQDDKPPLVQVFMNTDAFVQGGITDINPKILVKCADDFGMNVSGVTLGHDLTAVLDGNVQETIVLNDFYQSEQDNFRKGQALYPLRNLAAGRHTLRVKGWDVANNSDEGYTEFVVAEDGKTALDHVLNYPNPFTTNTYFQFEHTLAGQVLDVQISIFTVAGRLVKTILHSAPSDGYRVNDIAWDGKDDYGDQLARGVYLYRVKVRGTDLSGKASTVESDFEKLVILK